MSKAIASVALPDRPGTCSVVQTSDCALHSHWQSLPTWKKAMNICQERLESLSQLRCIVFQMQISLDSLDAHACRAEDKIFLCICNNVEAHWSHCLTFWPWTGQEINHGNNPWAVLQNLSKCMSLTWEWTMQHILTTCFGCHISDPRVARLQTTSSHKSAMKSTDAQLNKETSVALAWLDTVLVVAEDVDQRSDWTSLKSHFFCFVWLCNIELNVVWIQNVAIASIIAFTQEMLMSKAVWRKTWAHICTAPKATGLLSCLQMKIMSFGKKPKMNVMFERGSARDPSARSSLHWVERCFCPLSTELNDASAWRIGVPVAQFVVTLFTTTASCQTESHVPIATVERHRQTQSSCSHGPASADSGSLLLWASFFATTKDRASSTTGPMRWEVHLCEWVTTLGVPHEDALCAANCNTLICLQFAMHRASSYGTHGVVTHSRKMRFSACRTSCY